MKVSYFLNNSRKKNLYCRISDGTERVSFSLGYTIEPDKWNDTLGEVSIDDPYVFALGSFKKYLTSRYHKLKSQNVGNVLNALKDEADRFIEKSGIEGVAEKLFNEANKTKGIPPYREFIQAFEQYSGFDKKDYKAQVVGEGIHFYTSRGEVYEMDTYEGLKATLKSFVDRRSYEEIANMTDSNFWDEIFVDDPIPKQQMLPVMLHEWERYWQQIFEDISTKIGKTEHLVEQKNQSWREFCVFMECYDADSHSISLAQTISDDVLFPISVIAMLRVFDPETCYDEYCESEFDGGTTDWESTFVTTKPENIDSKLVDNSPGFYVRLMER